ncbi:MAG: serine--tRNA ligase [Xanthobacteraceae bacterium]|jgi:seryl-tRNA synthetase
MHDIRFIRESPDAFDRALARRGLSLDDRQKYGSEHLLSKDVERRSIIAELEKSQKQRNEISANIGRAKREGAQNVETLSRDQLILLRTKIQFLENRQKAIEQELEKLLAEIPNIPFEAPEVPDGKDSNDNVERHRFGAKRDYSFTPKQHFDLGEALGQMDFETAAKLSGARFVVLKKGLARLERALGQFMLDLHTTEHGYAEVAPPLLVRYEAMFGTAQLPKFKEDQFETSRNPVQADEVFDKMVKEGFRLAAAEVKEQIGKGIDAAKAMMRFEETFTNQIPVWRSRFDSELSEQLKLWLIPTAEVPLTNLALGSVLDQAELPMRLTACTPCFRAEAGAAGKDTRGMIRQHQFTKVELVSITTPEQSKDEHERMLSCAEEVLKRLDLHYRVMTLCTGDMGFAAQKTYDIEVWLPGQGMYREISSCSVCGEFQARRMNARYRTKEGRNVRHVHTLNGSGVAVGRALIAVMETYQQDDGAIAVPEALASYMGGIKKIEK